MRVVLQLLLNPVDYLLAEVIVPVAQAHKRGANLCGVGDDVQVAVSE